MGSSAVAAWIAHLAFWILLTYGWAWDELGPAGIVTFLLLWTAGLLGIGYIASGLVPFSSYVAVLDIALVFLIFKGDVRIT